MTDYILGFNGATIPRKDILTRVEATASAGYEYYEPRVPALKNIVSKGRVELVRRKMDELKLEWLPLNALEEAIFPDNMTDFQKIRDEIFNLADRFGISTVIVVPAVQPAGISANEAFNNALNEMRSIKEKANSLGVDIAFEMIGFHDRAFNSVNAARELAEELRIPLVIDTFHLAMSKATSKELAELSPQMIKVVHVSDAIVSDSLNDVTDSDRVIPGEGDLSLEKYLRPILNRGFKGPFSIEVFHEKYGREDPVDVAKKSYDSTLDLIKRSS